MKTSKKKLNRFNKNIFPTWLLFLSAGFITGIISLILSVINFSIINPNKISTLWNIFLLVLTEEIIRFIILNFICPKKTILNAKLIINTILFGFGFGFFELFLIYLNSGQFGLLPAFSLFLTHSIFSLIIVFSVFFWKKSISSLAFLAFLLALLTHSIYNLVIHIYIY